MDDDPLQRDDMIAWACFRLCRLREGVRLVHLHDDAGKRIKGTLLVRIRKSFEPDR